MKAVMSAMPAFMRMSLATMFQYRGEIVLWAVWGVVYPAVAMAMWSAAVKGAEGGAQIKSLAPADFAAYFLLTMVVGHVATAWDIYEMSYLVRSGRMSPKLLRPILPIWQSLADNLSYKVLTLVILVPIWAGVGWVSRPAFETTPMHVAAGIPAMLLGGALSFLLGYTLSLLAFWVTRVDALGLVWFGMSLFFGGRLAPLSILPMPLQWMAAVLPFKWMIWFPTATLAGWLTAQEIARGIAFQMLWLVGGIALFKVLWRSAVRQYSAVGA